MEEKLGYTPAEAIEVQTLMGDTIDNVPGVPGVGEKTAVKLIKKYGTAEACSIIWMNSRPSCGRISRRSRPLMRSHAQAGHAAKKTRNGFRSRGLASYTGLNNDALRTHLTELGFTQPAQAASVTRPQSASPRQRSARACYRMFPGRTCSATPPRLVAAMNPPMRRRHRRTPRPTAESAANCDYHLVATEDQFAEFLDELKSKNDSPSTPRPTTWARCDPTSSA